MDRNAKGKREGELRGHNMRTDMEVTNSERLELGGGARWG